MTPFSALAVALVVVLCAMQAHGQVTGYTMTNANIRVAVHECALESQVGAVDGLGGRGLHVRQQRDGL